MRPVALILLAASAVVYAQASLEMELVKAAEANDVKKVRQLLDAGAKPELPRTFSALEAACAGAFPDVVREMLRQRVDLKARDSAGRTALNVVGATAVGTARENMARVARMLIANGADVNARDHIHGNTLLHEAPDVDTARVLIEAGAELNIRNKDGQTPLMLTLDEDVARLLVAEGADISIRDKNGKTALDLAREMQLTEKIAVLTPVKK